MQQGTNANAEIEIRTQNFFKINEYICTQG